MRSLNSVLFIVLVFSLAAVELSNASGALYTILLKTGSKNYAGTDSKITLTLKDSAGNSVQVPNLESWGIMPKGHDYFERNNLDVFYANASCICTPICYLKLTSDGKGIHPGWFVDYVEVTMMGSYKCGHTVFNVNRWLAVDEPPRSLTAEINQCADLDGSAIVQNCGFNDLPELNGSADS